ncbi:uncharacterized protein [Oryctolagus cuniculus]|uniref:uncharacterized protein isoform X2 n=1 Tax=Oryctolagus cuniculus TaxID=9986 RepID=UPI00387988E3
MSIESPVVRHFSCARTLVCSSLRWALSDVLLGSGEIKIRKEILTQSLVVEFALPRGSGLSCMSSPPVRQPCLSFSDSGIYKPLLHHMLEKKGRLGLLQLVSTVQAVFKPGVDAPYQHTVWAWPDPEGGADCCYHLGDAAPAYAGAYPAGESYPLGWGPGRFAGRPYRRAQVVECESPQPRRAPPPSPDSEGDLPARLGRLGGGPGLGPQGRPPHPGPPEARDRTKPPSASCLGGGTPAGQEPVGPPRPRGRPAHAVGSQQTLARDHALRALLRSAQHRQRRRRSRTGRRPQMRTRPLAVESTQLEAEEADPSSSGQLCTSGHRVEAQSL